MSVSTSAPAIRFVLVRPTHPGNIGATARAMKTMGLAELYLVSPKCFPDEQATRMAAGATSVLDKAVVVETLTEALQDCTFILGTSARLRHHTLPQMPPAAAAKCLVEASHQAPVALLFGCEHSGLSNAELSTCHAQVYIDTDAEYGSLNLAAAAQILAYEIRLASHQVVASSHLSSPPAPHQELQAFLIHLEQTLNDLAFLRQPQSPKLLQRLTQFFNRAQPQPDELNILRGIFTAIQRQIQKPDHDT